MSGDLTMGSVVAGKYRVEEVLGEGGMGLILLATHLQLEQRVAIKTLRPESVKDADTVASFVREGRAAARIRSEHVVRVHDVGELEDGTPYMVMEYLEGRDLGALLAERVILPVDEAVGYILQACEGLAETHAAGIVHRDLKPANVFLARRSDGSSQVKLLDFGISQIAVEATSRESIRGTPEYMAPERVEHGRKVDARCDIWSAGAILYELLVGETPFAGEEPSKVFQMILSTSPPPMLRRDLPEGLQAIVMRCLEKNPKDRYPTAADLACVLAEFAPSPETTERVRRIMRMVDLASSNPSLSAATIPSREAPTVLAPASPSKRKRWRLQLAVLSGAVGLVGLGIVALRARAPSVAPEGSSVSAAAPPFETALVPTVTVPNAGGDPSSPSASAAGSGFVSPAPQTPRVSSARPKKPASATTAPVATTPAGEGRYGGRK